MTMPEDRACAHKYSYKLQPDSHEATDTEGGYRHYRCTECGAEYAYETTPLVYTKHPKTGKPVTHAGSVNPNLPLWEHVPDAEPHVFWSKKDKEWRVYLYGSHDTGEVICGSDQVTWSAPVYDLSGWRFDGQNCDVYEKEVPADLKLNALFAPDTDYDLQTDTYYMMTFEVFDSEVLRRSTSPDGRFDEEDSIVYKFCDETGWGPYVTTDPAIYIENGTIYVIASIFRSELTDRKYVKTLTSAPGLQELLDKVTADGDPSDQLALICQMKQDPSQGVEKLHYCSIEGKGYLPIMEGVSLRRDEASGYYIMVYYGNEYGDYTDEKTTEGLAYVYTDDLMNGEWIMGDNTHGGNVIYDNNGVYLKNPNTGKTEKVLQKTYTGGNNHGGLVKINGKWYISGHITDGTHRMNTIEQIELLRNADGSLTIPAAEMTSSGAADSLDAYETWNAGIACYITPGLGKDCERGKPYLFQNGKMVKNPDFVCPVPMIASFEDNTKSSHGYPGSYDMTLKHVSPVTHITNEDILGYKYLDFGEKTSILTLNLLVSKEAEFVDGAVAVYVDAPSEDGGIKIGTLAITETAVSASGKKEEGSDGSRWTWISGKMDREAAGVHAVYFVFTSETENISICSMDQFRFA